MTLETTTKRKDTAPRQAITHHLDEYPLGEIAVVQQGYTFTPSYQGQAAGKWLYVKVGDLNAHGNTKYLDKTLNYVDDIVLEEMGAKPFPPGSIIFPRVGAALRNNNKRILRYASLTDDNVIIVTVRDTHSCSAEYLYYWFDSQDLQRFCNDGTVPVINGTNLKRQRVPLPSFALQQVIASLLSAWDTAIQKTEQLIAAKERHYSHELSRLISRGQQPHAHVGTFAEEVSARNRGGRPELLGDFLTESREPDADQDPFRRLTVRLHLQGVEARAVRGTESDGATCYFRRRAGHLIYGRQNIFRGAIGIIPPELDGYASTQDLPAFDIADGIDPQWLYFWLSRKDFYTSLEALATGSGSKRLHPEEFFKVRIFVPALATQTAIARYLNALREEIGLLGQSVAALKTQKRGLMQKLLTGQWRVPVSALQSEHGNF